MPALAHRTTPVEVVHSSPAMAAGFYGNVFITVYRGEMHVEEITECFLHHGTLQTIYPEGTGVIVYPQSGTPIPPASVRSGAMELNTHYEEKTRGVGIILFGEGFWASAARSVLTAMMVLARMPYPVRLFGSAEEAAEWTLEQAGGVPEDISGLADAIEQVRLSPA